MRKPRTPWFVFLILVLGAGTYVVLSIPTAIKWTGRMVIRGVTFPFIQFSQMRQ